MSSVTPPGRQGPAPAADPGNDQAGPRRPADRRQQGVRTGRAELLALDQVSLTVAAGEFVCIIGASGCGKSTLLNLVAGLDRPSAGDVATGGRKVGADVPGACALPLADGGKERGAGAAGQRACRRAERRTQTAELLETVRLGGFGDKRPHELSGGMRQRVALARALAQDADVLLMDEPFGALDAMTRDLLHDELERICAERTLTVLFVTHNVREAARLGDRVIVLSSRPGRVIAEYEVPRRRAAPDGLARGSADGGHADRPAARGDGPPWPLTCRPPGAARPRQPGARTRWPPGRPQAGAAGQEVLGGGLAQAAGDRPGAGRLAARPPDRLEEPGPQGPGTDAV